MDRQTKHMSGGWRMRVALAQALFARYWPKSDTSFCPTRP
jgi:ABC-type dipeptide/oligopeptide/nickel transport system ATPase subunit